MNREIKFRAWEPEHKFMIPVVYLFSHKLDGCLNYYNYGAKNPELPLMQYTGLKDKNGKEIYEGDILRFQFSEWCISPVYWTKERGWTVHGNITAWEYSIGSDFSKSNLEVIGNIYENPELLEKS